jgi:glucose uptake protein GlcU
MSTSSKIVVLILGVVAVMVLVTGLLIGSVVDQARKSVNSAVYKVR